MSGDVQPRKRKDKKRKREEDEGIHHGVHATKMGTDDVHLHVQSDHGTGGHWCAKIFFFSLLAILVGLIGLIIMENRGLADLDTPLSESRYSEYFEGWVDEHRESHDHDPHEVVAHEIEEHEEHDEPFEEEEDVSEPEEELVEHEEDDEHDDEDHDDDTADVEEDEEEADEDEDEDTAENEDEEKDNVTQEDVVTKENQEDEEDEEESKPIFTRVRRAVPSQEAEVSIEGKAIEETKETDVDEQEEDGNDENEPFEEEDDDTTFEVVDNDAEEIKILQEKARKIQEETDDVEPEVEEESYVSPQIKPRSGGGPQAFETEDEYIEEQLRRANQHMLQDNIDNALKIYESLILKNPDSYGAFLGKAVALDKLSEQQKSNSKLKDAIFAYKKYLAFGDDIKDDVTYRKTAERCIERMRFLGLVSQAVAIHENLINRFQNDLKLQNELAVTYLLNNQLREAKIVLHNTLMKWPNDGFAKVHYGFVLKNLDRDLENAVNYLKDGINSNQNGTQDGRFYFNLGEALQRLNRSDEAMEVFRKGAKRKLFPSEYQRSLYNVNNLRAKPFWLKKEFPNDYQDFFSMLERNWRQIREEGINALNEKKYFIDEAENLKDKGDWKQFELYAQGIKKIKNCEKARVTCALIETFPPARYCRRGQTKFSIMDEGTHVWPHCGPTNCRLRAHLGLKVPSGTKIRVAKDLKTWEEGKFLIFDDSFEHEVWHNGTSPRLVLIVDIWHPDLSESERKSLSPI